MLPFMAQGACQAVEDAAVLAGCLAGAKPDAIADPLRRYETLRKPRVWDVQRASWSNATTYHLPDGERQRARDAGWAASAARGPYAERGWLFAYDAEASQPVH
jgi:salicylate hydroxylase